MKSLEVGRVDEEREMEGRRPSPQPLSVTWAVNASRGSVGRSNASSLISHEVVRKSESGHQPLSRRRCASCRLASSDSQLKDLKGAASSGVLTSVTV